MREWVTMECTACHGRNYRTNRAARVTTKLERKKYCPTCRKHTPHKERKK